jgi:HAE1 family hydrophobic/amphiphilic exporter-1
VTLSDISIQRPVFTWMLMMALLVFGLLGYARLGVDQYPEMDFPVVTVDARLEGASPDGIEEDVTDILEERLNSIANVRSLRSTSYQGIARIEIEFELGTDLDNAIQDVRDQVALARARLPDAVEPPVITRRDMSRYAVIYAATADSRSDGVHPTSHEAAARDDPRRSWRLDLRGPGTQHPHLAGCRCPARARPRRQRHPARPAP